MAQVIFIGEELDLALYTTGKYEFPHSPSISLIYSRRSRVVPFSQMYMRSRSRLCTDVSSTVHARYISVEINSIQSGEIGAQVSWAHFHLRRVRWLLSTTPAHSSITPAAGNCFFGTSLLYSCDSRRRVVVAAYERTTVLI